VLILATIVTSGVPSVNTAVAAIVVLMATLYGAKSLSGVLAAGGHFSDHRWDEGKSQLIGSGVGLALAAVIGTASFTLGGVGALY
jgi:hypothetical protein